MKHMLYLLVSLLPISITYPFSYHESSKKKFSELMHLMHDIKNASADTKKLELTLRMTPIGKRMLSTYNKLSKGKTGFIALDTLNEQLGTKIVAYKQGCLLLECLHQLSTNNDHLLDAYNNLPGTGKFWNVEESSEHHLKKKPKKILVQLTAQASQDFILNQAQIQCEEGIKETGIQSLDILNHNYEATIIDTLRVGAQKNVGLTIEFSHPIASTILDEYRNLPEIAKVEPIAI